MHGQKNEGSNDTTKGLPRFSKHSQRPSTIQQSSVGDIDTFTHKPWYAHTCFSHWPFHTQTPLHTDAFFTQTLLHTNIFTQKCFYTQTLLHTDTFTHRPFYPFFRPPREKFEPQAAQPSHGSFWLQRLIVQAKQLYTETLLHTKSQHRDAFTARRCDTQSL